jgi:large subunit ribosomal protein L10
MNREEKAAVIDQVAGEISAAEAIFAVDYRGITVSQVADLRVKLRDSDTKLRVVKNSLAERAADQAGMEDLKPLLAGPTALALVAGDAALAAKTLNDTARVLRGPLEFKGGLMSGAILSPEDVRSIARLPAREVLHAQLVGTIAAPLSGLVRGLNSLIAGLAIQLKAIADQGLVTGTAPEPAAAAAEPDVGPEPEAEPEAPAAEPAVEAEAPAEEPAAEAVTEEPEPDTPEAEAEATPEPEAPAEEPEATATEQPEGEAASDAAESSDE